MLIGAAVPAAAEPIPFLHAPSLETRAAPEQAAVFDLKLQLPEGRGLARLLLDQGVDQDDAALAARLAAGHLGDRQGGCTATVSISRDFSGSGLRLQRLVLATAAGQTVVERRNGELSITSATADAATASHLI